MKKKIETWVHREFCPSCGYKRIDGPYQEWYGQKCEDCGEKWPIYQDLTGFEESVDNAGEID